MTKEQFIAKRVNMSRGGYRPEEVVQLIRLAWEHGKMEKQEEMLKQLDNLPHKTFDISEYLIEIDRYR